MGMEWIWMLLILSVISFITYKVGVYRGVRQHQDLKIEARRLCEAFIAEDGPKAESNLWQLWTGSNSRFNDSMRLIAKEAYYLAPQVRAEQKLLEEP